jgi:hypothetical protein
VRGSRAGRRVRALARCAAVVALLASPGCLRWLRTDPGELAVHGKAGLACSAVVTPLIWSSNFLLFPLSVAALGERLPSHDNLGYPGLAVENAAYLACSTAALPLHALGLATDELVFRTGRRERVEDLLINRLPHLSPADYALLVRVSGRTCPPVDDRAEAPGPAPAGGAATPGSFGYWSLRQAPPYGSKPRLGDRRAAGEWRDWRDAGRPRATAAEHRFVADRALAFADPAGEFAALYGAGRRDLLEEEVAARAREAEDLARNPDAAARERALRDPSPLLRSAALHLLPRDPDAGSAAALTRALGDPAVMVREAAADGLALLADPGTAAALGRALGDPDRSVRERAAVALGRIGTPEAAEALLASLGGTGHRARFQALAALAGTATPAAAAALARALGDPDEHTRIAAAAAIGCTARPGDPLLERSIADPDPRVSGAARRTSQPEAGPVCPP